MKKKELLQELEQLHLGDRQAVGRFMEKCEAAGYSRIAEEALRDAQEWWDDKAINHPQEE